MSEEKKSNVTVVVAMGANGESAVRYYDVTGASVSPIGALSLTSRAGTVAIFAPGSWMRYFLDDSAAEPRILGI